MTDHNGDPSLSFVDMDAGDYLTTGQSYVSGLANKAIWHAADPDLDASAANSARKWAGDAWRVSRRGSTGLTSPLESCMLAAWAQPTAPKSRGRLNILTLLAVLGGTWRHLAALGGTVLDGASLRAA